MSALLRRTLAATAFFAAGPALAAALPVSVYFNDFQTGVGPGWTQAHIRSDTNTGRYNGNFSQGRSTTLTLSGLPAHTRLSLAFDLYLFSTWDGENTTWGKDYFSLAGDVSGMWTFTNHQPQGQSYPGSPNQTFGSGMNATHVYRGLDPTGNGDDFLIDHADSTFSVTFGGPTTQSDEWWGIDNVSVTIDDPPVVAARMPLSSATVPEPGTLALLGITGLGLAALRRMRR